MISFYRVVILTHIIIRFLRTDQWDSQLIEAAQKVETSKEHSFPFISDPEETSDLNAKDSGIEEYILNDGSVNRHAVEMMNESSTPKNALEDTLSNVSDISGDMCHDELLRHRLSEVQLKLEEMTKTVGVERE